MIYPPPIFAIDPGPETSGFVRYECGRVCATKKAATLDQVRAYIESLPSHTIIACERVQSYGIAGVSLLRTSEVVGRIQEICRDRELVLMFRREVLQELDISGKGNRDALVRQRCIEIHGGPKAAKGTRHDRGPLYGVAGHAWQALGLGLAVLAKRERDLRSAA